MTYFGDVGAEELVDEKADEGTNEGKISHIFLVTKAKSGLSEDTQQERKKSLDCQ